MMTRHQLDDVINSGHDLSSLIRSLLLCVGSVEGELSPSYNRLLGDMRRLLELAGQKSEAVIDAFEDVEMYGYVNGRNMVPQ